MKQIIRKEDLLTKKVTYVPYLGAQSSRAITFREALFVLPTKEPMKSRINACRMMADGEYQKGLDDSASTRIKKSLPLWYPSGVYGGSRTKSDILSFSGLMSIDIDAKDNDLSPDEMKEILEGFKFVFYAGYSARGWGVFALIPIPVDGADGSRFAGYFRAVADIMSKNGLTVDPACSNVNRARFLASDDDPIIRDEVEVWETWKAPQVTRVSSLFGDEPDIKSREYRRMEILVSRLEEKGLDLFESQHDWFVAGRCLVSEFGEDGRGFFLRLSDLWSKVHGWSHQQDPNKMYSYLLKGQRLCGLGFIYAKAKEAGIYVPKNV